mgnify:CR=1 FL=1
MRVLVEALALGFTKLQALGGFGCVFGFLWAATYWQRHDSRQPEYVLGKHGTPLGFDRNIAQWHLRNS